MSEYQKLDNSVVVESNIASSQQQQQRYKNVVSDSRRKYSGYFVGQKKDGKGREEDFQSKERGDASEKEDTNQTIYEGNFREDKYELDGILYSEDTKCFFKGIFKANKKVKGIEILPNGDVYEGEYQDNLYHGKGSLKNTDLFFIDASKNSTKKKWTYSYQGKWEQQQYSIEIHIKLVDNSGQFSQGQRHGKGSETYARGGVYVGEFRNNKRHGKGKLQFANGSYYEGDFINGMASGFGSHLAYSLEQIEQIKPLKSEIKEDNPAELNYLVSRSSIERRIQEQKQELYNDDAFGNQSATDTAADTAARFEEKYKSDMDALMPSGGFNQNEFYYEGEFVEGFKHGKGRLYYPDGSYYYCQWSFNRKVSEILFFDSSKYCYCVFKYKDSKNNINHFYPITIDVSTNVETSNDLIEWIVKPKYGLPPNDRDGYKQQIDNCAISGEYFEDSSFVLEVDKKMLSMIKGSYKSQSSLMQRANSLQVTKEVKIEYLKINESSFYYYEEKGLFEDPIQPNQLVWNQHSDYQLISCFEALTAFPHVFFNIFTPRFDFEEIGYIVVKLYRQGKWQEIMMDDILPFYDDGEVCIFSTTERKDLAWLFLQKAFCKVYGSLGFYLNYDDKRVEEYLQMLSGLPSRKLEFGKDMICSTEEEEAKGIKELKNDSESTCKLAYLNPSFQGLKDIGIPVNFPFIVVEIIECTKNLDNTARSRDTAVILKSINPNYCRIKDYADEATKFLENNSQIKEALLRYQKREGGDFLFDQNKQLNFSQQSVFVIDACSFMKMFASVVILVGIKQTSQSTIEINEAVGVQTAEIRYFFSFNLNLPARILLNVEQHILNQYANLPMRIVLAKDKTSALALQQAATLEKINLFRPSTKKEVIAKFVFKKKK